MSVRSCGRVCVHEPRLRFAVERQTFQLNWCFTGNSNSATLTTDHWSSSAGLLTEEEEVKMKRLVLSLILLTTASSTGLAQESEARKPAPKPLRALLIAGGCCHDYAAQQKAICEGIQARAYVRVDVYWTDNSSTAPVFPLYKRLNWAEEYDVIIHDECAAAVKDQAMVNRIIKVHEKIPAVHLHCAMHSFRTGGDAWFKHLGLQSSSHGPQKPIDIQFTRPSHPITETLKNWTTINEELYNNVRVLGAKPLAIGKQKLGGANSRVNEAIVAWVNESAGARSFSTTIGHNTETVQDSRYLDLVTRGLLWACGKLEPNYLQPYQDENSLVFVDKTKVQSAPTNALGQRPKDSTLVRMIASSTQNGHPTYDAIDGKTNTRWCAGGGGYPQSLTFEFEKLITLSGARVVWEFERVYRYRVEGSVDGENWHVLLDRSDAKNMDKEVMSIVSKAAVKQVRIVGLGAPAGSWCSIREVEFEGPELKKMWPASLDKKSGKLIPLQANAFDKGGNSAPKIERMTAEREAEILRDVKVPEGFEATLFAASSAANYPVFVAASVDGTVFVSSDGNGSLGRDSERGRVIRLRDLDGDGRADETKVFCEVDAPRGLVWDHDRLYLMHPPNLSVFIDEDDDGVADIQKTLVKNLAFGYDKRPADHTTNGMSLGVDGWLYIAGGDFGFLNAEGADGTRLTHRGGGVIRVRPDGSGLEIYSTGTRNILEVAISPQMELFARDNTNDGGGWDVRLHHFTGSEDHGYPRLYKHFNDECVQPLADYGGGSGCGAVYIDEPGFGRWNKAPFTADWGTGSLFRHTVKPRGATYQETAKPESFIKMTRPTDADVDGNSRVYCASWKGATFKWNGPDVGFIVCVRPKNFRPDPMPNFAALSDDQLVSLFDSPSYRRRVEAQRTLMRRGNSAYQKLLNDGLDRRRVERQLLERLQENGETTVTMCLQSLGHADPVVVHTAIRCLARQQAYAQCFAAWDRQSAPKHALARTLAMMHRPEVVDGIVSRLDKATGPARRELLFSLCRLHFREGPWEGDSWGTRPDTRGPYYRPVTWPETNRIATVLHDALKRSSSVDAVALVETMQKNRIPADRALALMLDLARDDERLVPTAIRRLAAAGELPEGAIALFDKALTRPLSAEDTLQVVRCLARLDSAEAANLMIIGLHRFSQTGGDLRAARNELARSRNLNNQVRVFATLASAMEDGSEWADAALLRLIDDRRTSPEARKTAKSAVKQGWGVIKRRGQLINAAMKADSHHLDQQIWQAKTGTDAAIAKRAAVAIERLRIRPPAIDKTPKLATLSLATAAGQLVATRGDVSLGQQVFNRANCAACHSLSKNEVQKGPFLGSIAKTYKRPELAAALLEPSKTIAQGFATNQFITVNGQVYTGFVTDEQSDRVTFRDQNGKATTLLKEDIDERKTSKISVMPVGLLNNFTVREVASLLDFIQALPK